MLKRFKNHTLIFSGLLVLSLFSARSGVGQEHGAKHQRRHVDSRRLHGGELQHSLGSKRIHELLQQRRECDMRYTLVPLRAVLRPSAPF